MPLLLAILLVLLILAIGFSLAWNLLGLIVMLLVAGIVGWIADLLVPGRLPWGWLGAILAGLVGSWLGVLLIGRVGPDVAGIPIVPALLGAVILAVLADLLIKQTPAAAAPRGR